MQEKRFRWLEYVLRKEEKDTVRVVMSMYMKKKGKEEDQKTTGGLM